MHSELIDFIRAQYPGEDIIPLHAPRIGSRESELVQQTLDSTFVSSVGACVTGFEQQLAQRCSMPYGIATVNGTAALHTALHVAGVEPGDLVITQPLTFVATCNAIRYQQADPLFVDVERSTLGMSPEALAQYLEDNAELDARGVCRHKASGRVIRACLPMHTFGHPCRINLIATICQQWKLALIEDAAEALGSEYMGRSAGSFAPLAALSFNGNKIITCGGGGLLLCRDATQAQRARHLTTTAKAGPAQEYFHDEVGYNYRMPNLNAALGCAQLEQLDNFLANKRALAGRYADFFSHSEFEFIHEPENCRSNYWLNAVLCSGIQTRDQLLAETQQAGVHTRPAWQLMHTLPMYRDCLRGPVNNAEWLAERLVNLPSSVTTGACA